jgi:2Fe-2S ferredoxin
MPTVIVEPKGTVLLVGESETIMGAAQRLGYQWPTVCGGEASCKACTCEVRSDPDALEQMSRLERTELERSFPTLHRDRWPLRLACQAKPLADVTVFKRGVRLRPDAERHDADPPMDSPSPR